MSNPWYRAWVGLVSDPKIGEAALIADVPVSIVIAVWHALLESASEVDDGGLYSTSARRISVILREPPARIEAVLVALAELGMIRDGEIVAWEKRQPVSESNADAAERQRQSRAARRAARGEARAGGAGKPGELPLAPPCHNLSQDVTPPESESETDRSSSAAAGASEIDLSKAKPLPTRDLLEAEARALMGELPVVVDPDFSPVRLLLDEPGVTRADVIAGLTEAAAANFRPVSWRQLPGWVRKAAKNRIGAAADLRGARGPPPRRAARQTDLSACLEIALGQRVDAPSESAGFSAGAGPIIDGRAVAL